MTKMKGIAKQPEKNKMQHGKEGKE